MEGKWKLEMVIPSFSEAQATPIDRNPEQQFTGRPFDVLTDRNLVVIDSAPSSPYISGTFTVVSIPWTKKKKKP